MNCITNSVNTYFYTHSVHAVEKVAEDLFILLNKSVVYVQNPLQVSKL